MNKIIKIILFLVLTLPIHLQKVLSDEKIKIGLLVPLTGKNAEIGNSIIKATQLAINKINNSTIEIHPKDTKSNPGDTLRAAKELGGLGIKIIIGPVFNDSLTYLDELKDITFLSFTNKSNNTSKNIISAGINATSQLKTIKKFIERDKIKKTIFLTPNKSYKNEIEKAITNSKLKITKNYIYDPNPTKLTNQIEKITNYKKRKQNLQNEITRLEKSNDTNKEHLIEKLKKKDTLGDVKFDAIPR